MTRTRPAAVDYNTLMARIDDLLAAMTLEEKVSLTAGADMWHTPPVPRLAVPPFRMSDGPVGARGTVNSGGPPSACFPCGTALAATWDVELVGRVGAELAAEARAKGAHLLLAPTVNIHRSPLAGRNFECYSEDPYLTARMAVAYIAGVQGGGVGACIKHFVGNESEFERHTMSSEIPERALREIYLRPFEVALAEVRPVAVMAAYNKLGGTWCSEHPGLLTTILRDEWGYDGLLVSDWWATHTTAEALAAGLDLEMPGPTLYRGDALADAVGSGVASEADLDRSVKRILLAMERTGALDGEGGGTEASEDTPERRAVARAAAGAAIVLLRNQPVGDAALLPLDPAALRRVAVVGPNADALTILGGGSAAVSPTYAVTALDGLREALPQAEVVHEPGCSIARSVPRLDPRWMTGDGEAGVMVAEYFSSAEPTGEADVRHAARRPLFSWAGVPVAGMPADGWSARMRTTVTPPRPGVHRLQLRRRGRARLFWDGELLLDGWDDEAVHLQAMLDLDAEVPHELVIEFAPPETAGMAGLDVRLAAEVPEDLLDRAVAAAADADAVVVVVGTDQDWETEGQDRRSMDLPPPQDELVARVVAANPRTIVVVNAGAPVTMEWADHVPAIVQLWFGGQEQGRALADVLTGLRNPSGRLPTTFPRRYRDNPAYGNYPGEFGQVHYGEGLLIGYRWYDARRIEPRFPFGHGLSYTSFDHGPLTLDANEIEAAATVQARVEVTNTGDRSGAEVVQLYTSAVGSAVARPDKQLVAFAKIDLDAGATGVVTFDLGPDAFSAWNPEQHGWWVEPGAYELRAGASSADIRSTAALRIRG